MRILAIFVSIALFFSGCQQAKESTASAASIQRKPVEGEWLTVFYWEEGEKKSPFEPDAGCLTGAYIVEDRYIGGNMDTFEAMTEKEHDIYEQTMMLGESYPMFWVMECAAKEKIPMLRIYPKDRNHPYDTKALEKTAEAVGKMGIPLLIEFYPIPSSYGEAEEYKEFYRRGKEIFRKKAPFSAFIWSVGAEEQTMAEEYYPGDAWVDWIGLHLYEKGGYQQDGEEKIKNWYYTWQKEKPLLLLPAISHYSSVNATYTEQEGARELMQLYQMLSAYPRIKGVIYQDVNMNADAPSKAQRENYLITDNTMMLESYQSAMKNPWFEGKEEERKGSWYRCAFQGYYVFGSLYLQTNSVLYELQEVLPENAYFMDGRYWVMAEDIEHWQFKKEASSVYAVEK